MGASTIIVGIGGMGSNTVNNLVTAKKLENVDFAAANTDVKALDKSLAEHGVQLGAKLTKGLGASGNPIVGKASAEESLSEITDLIKPYSAVIFIAGLGGGTGSGAIPVFASGASGNGKKVSCIVTTPFQFEGKDRDNIARKALKELDQAGVQKNVFNNQELFKLADDRTTFSDAFRMVDDTIEKWIATTIF